VRWWQQHKERPMKYICLGYYDPARHAAMTEQEREAMFDECFEYDDHLRANGHFFGGEALQPSETALTLYWKNGKVATTDGPYAETKEQLGGILVLEARHESCDSTHVAASGGKVWDDFRDPSDRRYD